MKDLALLLMEFLEPFSQPIKITLDGTITLWCVSCSSQFCVTPKFASSYSSLRKMLNKIPSIDPLEDTPNYKPPAFLGPSCSQFPVHCFLCQPILPLSSLGGFCGRQCQNLTEVRVCIHCYLLVKQASHFIMEGCQIDQVTDTSGRQQMGPKILISE